MSSRHTLTAPGAVSTVYDIDAFSCLTTGEDAPALDFSSTTFTRPVGMVGLLALMDRMRRQGNGREIPLVLPRRPEVRVYWRLAGIMDALREFCVWPEAEAEESLSEYNPVTPIVPCTHFRNEQDVEIMSEKMERNFATTLSGYASLLDQCSEVFIELTTNVLYHAESNGGFVLAQQYNYDTGPAVEIAVADSGMGIRESLTKNSELTGIDSDRAAVKKALDEGVTSAGSKHRGFGLAHVVNDVRQESARLMAIRSGDGTIVISGDGETQEMDTTVRFPGTIINVTIPLESLYKGNT